MERPVRRALVVASLAAVVACGPEASQPTTPADTSTAAESLSASPATCGKGPLDSALALVTSGGGCTPFDLGAVKALQAALGGDVGALQQGLQQLSAVDPEWAPVVNGEAGPESTPVLLHGTVIDSHLSTTDFPSTHVTIDQNTDILLDDEDAGCAATGNATAELDDVGPIAAPHLELEWEAGSYPTFAWAGPGDRIVALGRWIFDCGHEDAVPGACAGTTDACILDSDCAAGSACVGTVFNYHSELHPPQAVAVLRTGRGAPMPQPGRGGEPKPIPVTRADVFVSGDGGGAGDRCVLTPVPLPDLLGLGDPADAQNCFPFSQPLAPINDFDFAFDVPLPDVPHEGLPFWRTLAQADGAPTVPAEVRVVPVLGAKPHLHVAVLMTKRVRGELPTGFAGTLLAGWRHAKAPHLRHVRVTIEGVDIRDPLAHLIPVPNPKAWRVEASVNGEWQRVAPDIGVDVPSFPHTFALDPALVFDEWLPPHGKLAVHAQGESEGCEDLVRGNAISTIVNGVFGGDLLAAAACNADTEDDTAVQDDEIDAAFEGPRFGAQEAPHVVASEKGVWAIQFRIEAVDDED